MNSSMNTIHFFTNMGFHLAFDILITKDTNNPAAQELSIHLNYVHKELHAELAHSNEQMAVYYNCKCTSPPKYSSGDLVLLLHWNHWNIKTTHSLNKLNYCYLDSFEVLEKCR